MEYYQDWKLENEEKAVNRIVLKVKKVKLSWIFLVLLFHSSFGYAQSDFIALKFRGIRPDDHIGLNPLRNPGRGIRIEDTIDFSSMRNVRSTISQSVALLRAAVDKYSSDSVSLVQTTLFFSSSANTPIADSVLQGFQIYLDTLKEMGLMTMLNLDYQTKGTGGSLLSTATIQHHLEQLQGFLNRNSGVILAIQAGFIGSGSSQGRTALQTMSDHAVQLTLLKKLLAIVPATIQVEVYSPEIKNLLALGDPDYERIGFFDKQFGQKSSKSDKVLREGTPLFEQVVRESAATMVDGSYTGGKNSGDQSVSFIDGYKAVLRLRLQHFSSISVARNNLEIGVSQKYSMMGWRDIPVQPDQLKSDKMPYAEENFVDGLGNTVVQPLFYYVRDHLGYRIELQRLLLPAKRTDNSPIVLKLELVNRGFSAVKHPCTAAFVLIDPTGKVYELPAEGNPKTWQPFATGDLDYKPISYEIKYQGKLPLHLMPGKYKLGLWLAPENQSVRYDFRYDIRCANGNMGWWISRDRHYGINLLTSLTISK